MEVTRLIKAYLQQVVVGGKVMLALNDDGEEKPSIREGMGVSMLT